jgi:mannose/fructose-specific phosphotransferase system component IIA
VTRLVLVTHPGLGEALRDIAAVILGAEPELTVVSVAGHSDPETVRGELERLLGAFDEPPLLLTDLPGATPHNIAARAAAAACPGAPLVSGLNLPMLLRALNHRQRPARELAGIAAEGARRALEPADGT